MKTNNNENNSRSVVVVAKRTGNSLIGAVTKFARGVNDAVCSLMDTVSETPVAKAVTVAVGVLFAGGTAAQAQSAPDASAIVSTASTTFNTVGALVASAVGFFIIVKIVNWIRK